MVYAIANVVPEPLNRRKKLSKGIIALSEHRLSEGLFDAFSRIAFSQKLPLYSIFLYPYNYYSLAYFVPVLRVSLELFEVSL
tara:strand:- start:617 stop:862 length:246 start_codon:yes stop_codon:yes gene_type:complete